MSNEVTVRSNSSTSNQEYLANGIAGQKLTMVSGSPRWVKEDNVITVAKNGGDFTTIKDAIAAASGTVNTSVLVYPGVYSEDNPVVGKLLTTVKAIGGQNTVVVEAANAEEHLFSAVSSFFVQDVTLKDVVGVGKYAVDFDTGTGVVLAENIILDNCSNGFHQNNPTGQLLANNIAVSGTTNKVVHVEAGAAIARTISAIGNATIDTLIHADGASAVVTINNITSTSSNLTTAIRAENGAILLGNIGTLTNMTDGLLADSGANVSILGLTISNAQTDAFRIDPNGSGTSVGISSCIFRNSARYDAYINSSTAVVSGLALVSIDKIEFVSGALLTGAIIDSKEDDEGFKVIGELDVGLPEHGSESSLGEGDSYTRGMLVYQEAAAGGFTDVSTVARSASGSSFALPGTAENDAIYVASSLTNGGILHHYGIKANLETAMVLGSGELVSEYWNGSAYIEFTTSSIEADADYIPFANKIFERTGSEHIRNNPYITPLITAHDPMSIGTDYYWIRYRVKTAITTAPIFQQFKLHTNHTEFNSDGWPEYFGKARPIGRLSWDLGVMEKAGADAADQDLYLGEFLDVGRKKNRFDNAKTSRVGFNSVLPMDCDTSAPIIFQWSVISSGVSGGDVDWVIRWGASDVDSNVYRTTPGIPAPGQKTITTSLAAPTASDKKQWYQVELDISDIVSRRDGSFPDGLWVSIQRSGTVDSHTDAISLVTLNANYTKWSEGGHVNI